ncbi:low temperature requirement protein LtrA [Arthrobacter silviterrae]|uniref:Low temperature requirement protein A n=1 Tax=Arthrobacter silviterrae TaxID=2026658 RepID=A0ABX0DFT3_9MICC|nr:MULTISPECIES: low temperature requirement protein A [Arthrobacter]MCU6481077.1 low temperature requirement protein A [Arthrobacter sp. A2-55]MDQ0278724.1 low temperature requirement protein LtrA [Arthrobacter silviterrae]NGN85478.1 low temperature requirement protein A [Arthrobacter silviterrae]
MSNNSQSRGAAPHAPAREPGRVHWMELFFDLIFVAFVSQLAHGIHGDPGLAAFGSYVLLFFPAWWAWVNMVSVINVLPGLSARALGLAMLAAMAAAGVMAAAAPGALGDRAWAFSLGNAALRAVLLVLWLHHDRHTVSGTSWRIWIYNGGTAALWLVSAVLPLHVAVVLWGAAIAVEIAMVLLSAHLWPERGAANINIEHASERLGLFVIIVLGESVVTIVNEVSAHWGPGPALGGALGFLVVALLGWSFFQYGAGTVAPGLERLRSRADFGGILQTTLFLPFLLVLGVTSVAAGIATAISAPYDRLPLGAGISLGGGLALYYGTNALVSLRYGQPPRRVVPWAGPTVALALLLIPLSALVPAAALLAAATALLMLATAYVELVRRRRPAGPGAP